MKPPEGDALKRLLVEVYRYSCVESFWSRVRTYKEKITKKDEILELIGKTNTSEDEVILKIVRALVS